MAFLITRVAWPDGSVAQWVELGLLGLGLAGIVVTVRPVATAASLTLPFAMVTLMMAPYASISLTSGDATLGRILIAVGLLGIAIGVGGVAASDPAAIRRWFLPFAIIAFVLALLGDALMFLGLALRGFSFLARQSIGRECNRWRREPKPARVEDEHTEPESAKMSTNPRQTVIAAPSPWPLELRRGLGSDGSFPRQDD